jgi:hypothetical protein
VGTGCILGAHAQLKGWSENGGCQQPDADVESSGKVSSFSALNTSCFFHMLFLLCRILKDGKPWVFLLTTGDGNHRLKAGQKLVAEDKLGAWNGKFRASFIPKKRDNWIGRARGLFQYTHVYHTFTTRSFVRCKCTQNSGREWVRRFHPCLATLRQ